MRPLDLSAAAVLLLVPALARADAWNPVPCFCNDDCVHNWPFTGLCVAEYGGTFCEDSGIGIPCKDGGPLPDQDQCSCNEQCPSPAAPFCNKGLCESAGPGVPCGDGGPDDVLVPCYCNGECSDVPGKPFCNYVAGGTTACTSGPSPGFGCPDDIYYVREGGTAMRDGGAARSDGGGAGLAPRSGCSIAGGAAESGLPGLLLLLFFARRQMKRKES